MLTDKTSVVSKSKKKTKMQARGLHPDDTGVVTSVLAPEDGAMNPGDWFQRSQQFFSTRLRKTLKHPPDGAREDPPPTRANAPKDWLGVMITDCGYAMLNRSAVDRTRVKTEGNGSSGNHDVPASRVALWLTGRDEFGRSTCIWIHHLLPYFYVGISHPDPEWSRTNAPRYATALHNYLEYRADQESTGSRRNRPGVLEVRPVKRRWFYGYRADPEHDQRAPQWRLDMAAAAAARGGSDSEEEEEEETTEEEQKTWDGSTTQASDWYLKVCVTAPFHVNKLRQWAAEWVELNMAGPRCKSPEDRWRVPVVRTTSTVMAPVSLCVFEANVEFSLRCMINLGLVGYGWCALDLSRLNTAGSDIWPDRQGRSRCQQNYVVDGRIFERAERARDAAYAAGTDPWDAINDALDPTNAKAPIRFVARLPEDQYHTDGVGVGTPRPDPMAAWFQDLRDAVAPQRVLSFDIECSNAWGEFPLPERDPVISLSARLYRTDRVEAYEKARNSGDPPDRGLQAAGVDPSRCKWPPPLDAVVMGIGEREPLVQGGMDGYPVASFSYDSEEAFLLGFAGLIRAWEPDVIEGYNSVAFDMAYLLIRAQTLGIEQQFWELGRLVGFRSKPRVQEFANKAKGARKEYRAHIHGMIQFDLMRVCVDDIAFKPRDYTLNNVGHELLGEGKKEMDYKKIPILHAQGPKGRQVIDEYCDADGVLPFKLDRQQNYLTRYIELARVTGVPMRFLLEKGQQVLVYAQILRKARQENYAVPWLPVVEPEQSITEARKNKAYEGAVVIDPRVGLYTAHSTGPVVVNDYNSLYPTSMISQNLGYVTHVTDPVAARLCRRQHRRLRDLHDTAVRQQDQWYDGDLRVRTYESRGCWKVAPVDSATRPDPVFVRQEVRKSLIAKILEALLAARAVAKHMMKKFPKGSPQYRVQDARQMALKVCANSVYGFTGAPVGRQPNLDISGATTACGRKALYFAKRMAEDFVPGDNEVVYGDSVIGETPIIVRFTAENTTPRMMYIQDLCSHDDGRWMQRRRPGETVAASGVREGEGGGKYVLDCEGWGWEVWSDNGWTPIKQVIRHKTNQQLCRVQTCRGSVTVTQDHSLLRHDGSIVRPRELRCGDRLLHATHLPLHPDVQRHRKLMDDEKLDFPDFRDLYSSCGEENRRIEEFSTLDNAMHTWIWEGSLSVLNTGTDGPYGPAEETVVRLQPWVPSRPIWVYDLETENHHFAAGVGYLVVHNTDSVMWLIKDACTHEVPDPGKPLSQTVIESVRKAFERGNLLDEAINVRVMKPVRIETEKVYNPFLLLGRKKYLTLVWVRANGPYGIDAKGIEMVRRDNPHIVGLACETFADLLMGKGEKIGDDQVQGLWPDLETAQEFLREIHRMVLEDELPFEAYIISAKYTKPADQYDTVPPHIALASRMEKRDKGAAPKLGDRIPYVIVRPEFSEPVRNHEKSVLYKDKRGVKVRDCAEDPKWAFAARMRIDNELYAKKKFEPPFLRMLAPILAPDELREGKPKDARMWTQQKRRHREHPEKLEQWIQDKRQDNAEAIVHQSVFSENYRARKIRRTNHEDCAIERAFAHAQANLEPDDTNHNEEEVQEQEEQEQEEAGLNTLGARDRMLELLKNIRAKTKARVHARKVSGSELARQHPPRRQRQSSITQFFQQSNSKTNE